MDKKIVELTLMFAQRWQLHGEGLYVDLHRLHERFRPHYVDLIGEGMLGCAVVAHVGREPLADIYIEKTLTIWDQRLVYSHELGHYICGHPDGGMTGPLNRWPDHRFEREAWVAAAGLLVPVTAIEPGMTEMEVASRAAVSVDLVRLLRNALPGMHSETAFFCPSILQMPKVSI